MSLEMSPVQEIAVPVQHLSGKQRCSVPITPSLELAKRRLIHTENCVGIHNRPPLYSQALSQT